MSDAKSWDGVASLGAIGAPGPDHNHKNVYHAPASGSKISKQVWNISKTRRVYIEQISPEQVPAAYLYGSLPFFGAKTALYFIMATYSGKSRRTITIPIPQINQLDFAARSGQLAFEIPLSPSTEMSCQSWAGSSSCLDLYKLHTAVYIRRPTAAGCCICSSARSCSMTLITISGIDLCPTQEQLYRFLPPSSRIMRPTFCKLVYWCCINKFCL